MFKYLVLKKLINKLKLYGMIFFAFSLAFCPKIRDIVTYVAYTVCNCLNLKYWQGNIL
jgi:hypothetical protein